jgi:uroporphyrinogen III methyltransferase/synthase
MELVPVTGKVYLAGAGPGDPGLITLRAAECLAEADLVLYDGLVNPLLLRRTGGICERTARTRRDGTTIVSQQEINERLIAEARAGKVVVRLKGGDPYIFGRGSEEAAALQAAGIPFEVIPGVTAATGAGEYAGFSFTHREISSAVAFVTGHEDPSREASRLDFDALARFPGTLVFYMGLNRLTEICRQLMAAGMPETTPAAVVCHASLATQQVVEGTLATIPLEASRRQLKPPSLIVVGECIRQRAQLSWFEQLPLFGVSIGVTRPDEQADDVASQIVRMGGEPVIMPMIEVGPVTEAEVPAIQKVLERLHEFQWLVFTSVNGVSEFFRHLRASGRDARALHAAKIAAIGTSTASKLESFGIQADFVPAEFRAESLGTALADRAQGQTVLWVRASRGRDVLPKLLQDAGVRLEQLVVYENRDVAAFSSDIVARLKSGTLQWVGLSSPSISRQFAQLLKLAEISPSELKTKIAAISSVTARAAEDCGLTVQCIARKSTWDGILDAIVLSRQLEPRRS